MYPENVHNPHPIHSGGEEVQLSALCSCLASSTYVSWRAGGARWHARRTPRAARGLYDWLLVVTFKGIGQRRTLDLALPLLHGSVDTSSSVALCFYFRWRSTRRLVRNRCGHILRVRLSLILEETRAPFFFFFLTGTRHEHFHGGVEAAVTAVWKVSRMARLSSPYRPVLSPNWPGLGA